MFETFNFHLYNNPVPVFAFNTTFSPEQKVVNPPADMVALGGVLTETTIAVDVAEHEFPLVTVTVYEPAVVAV